MGTIRRLTELQLGSIGTTKVMAVNSSETLYSLGSGNRAFEITNYGGVNLIFGQSSVLANSGSIIFPNGSRFFDNIVDNFIMYLAVNSGGINSNIVVQEYLGN